MNMLKYQYRHKIHIIYLRTVTHTSVHTSEGGMLFLCYWPDPDPGLEQ